MSIGLDLSSGKRFCYNTCDKQTFWLLCVSFICITISKLRNGKPYLPIPVFTFFHFGRRFGYQSTQLSYVLLCQSLIIAASAHTDHAKVTMASGNLLLTKMFSCMALPQNVCVCVCVCVCLFVQFVSLIPFRLIISRFSH